MDRASEIARTVEAHLATLGGLAQTIERDPRSTIEPAQVAADSAGGRAIEVLRALGGRRESGLQLERTLGQGGMGVVHLATQVSVGRKVAVKTLHADARDGNATLRLLREAWITGSLEHPNVVPVYDVAVDEQGGPVIVLKRIEGVHWGELIADPARVREMFGATDVLEWHLRVLLQVCNAVSFAHDRGVIHRDLKPENVMIGAFGEVYVLDWGLAVSLGDDLDGRLPLAQDAKEMAGTPAYMAPEMLGNRAADLGERTDVYLLGAILYEIAAGHPPHTGENLMAIVSSVVLSEPVFDDAVPDELARICRTALAREPIERYASAAELRRALSSFLQHRGSLRLTAEAEQSLSRLEQRLHEDPREAYDLFGECRFGFRAALAEWSLNAAAQHGLVHATKLMAEYELAQGNPRAAATLLAELKDPPSELLARVNAARADDDRKLEELRKLGRQMDPEIGSRTRTFVGLVLGILWTITPLIAGHFAFKERMASHAAAIVASLLLMTITGAVLLWARDSLNKTLINQRVAATIMFTLLAQILLHAGAAIAGIDALTANTLHFFLWFTVASLMAIHLEVRLWPTAVSYFIGFLVVGAWQQQMFRVMSACNLVLTLNLALTWGRNLRLGPAPGVERDG